MRQTHLRAVNRLERALNGVEHASLQPLLAMASDLARAVDSEGELPSEATLVRYAGVLRRLYGALERVQRGSGLAGVGGAARDVEDGSDDDPLSAFRGRHLHPVVD